MSQGKGPPLKGQHGRTDLCGLVVILGMSSSSTLIFCMTLYNKFNFSVLQVSGFYNGDNKTYLNWYFKDLMK